MQINLLHTYIYTYMLWRTQPFHVYVTLHWQQKRNQYSVEPRKALWNIHMSFNSLIKPCVVRGFLIFQWKIQMEKWFSIRDYSKLEKHRFAKQSLYSLYLNGPLNWFKCFWDVHIRLSMRKYPCKSCIQGLRYKKLTNNIQKIISCFLFDWAFVNLRTMYSPFWRDLAENILKSTLHLFNFPLTLQLI